jgi:PAS domain S-box-containing protein
VLLLAVLVLAGWALDNQLLKGSLPSQVAMKANTAVAFALAALALWLLAGRAAASRWQQIALGFALVVAALGAVSLIEYLLGANLGIDQLLFREPVGAFGTSNPGRMAPLTAVCFVLLGTALGCVTRPRLVLTAQPLAVLAAAIGLLSLIGYLYGAEGFYKLGPYTPMAPLTAAAFLALGIGVLCARPDAGLMRTVTSGTASSLIARRLLLAAVVLPVAFNWLEMQGQRTGFYDAAFGAALAAVASSLVAIALIWSTARQLERADRERRQAELEYHTILETAIDGFWVVDTESKLLEVNEAYCRMSGYSPDELLQTHISDLEATEAPSEIRRHIERVMAKGSDRFERRHRRKDGSLFDVDISVQYVNLRGGVFICFLQDITQRKQAEEYLRDTNAQLDRRVLERTAQLEAANQALDRQSRLLAQTQTAAKIGGWELDLVTRQLYWTEETYCIHELTPEHFTPTLESAINFYAPESRPVITAAIQAAMAEGREWDLELELITAKQRRIWVRASGKVQFADGQPIKAYGAFQDITERKQAEARLRLQGSALKSAANAIIITDRQGIIQWINPAFTQLTGYVVTEAVGRNPRELVKSGEHNDAFYQQMWATILDGRVWRGETINRRKDGTLFTEFQTITPVRDEYDQISHFIAIKQDITQRKQAEEVLRESEGRYRDLVENSLELITTHDLDGRILSANRAAAEVLGYDRKDHIGKTNLRQLLAPEVRDQFDEYLSRIRRDGVASGLMLVQTRTGERRIWEYHNTLRTEGVGTPTVRSMARDITERRKAEGRLAAQYVVTRALADSVTLAEATPKILRAICETLGWAWGALWTVDHKDNVLRCQEIWDDPSAKMSQFETASRELTFSPGVGLPGRVWADGQPAWVPDVVQDKNFARAPIAARENLHSALAIPIEAGSKVLGVMEFFSKAIREPDPELLAMMATVSSQIGQFIERKRAEAKILSEQLFSESIVNSLPGIFYLFDQTGKFLRWNKNFEQITGYSAEEIATLSPVDLFAGPEKEFIAQRIQEVFASGAADAEAHLVSRSGQRTPYYFTGVRIDSNDHRCLIGVGLDITERKHAEEALRESEEQQRQSQKMEAIGQLAGGVAHDFNNLLTAINGYSALALQRIDDNHPLKGYLEEIKKAGDRAANLTRQLLAFGRKQILQPLPINLNDVVTDMNKMLRRLIGEDIELTAKLDPALKKIKADPGQVEQVLVNLVVNARDAMPQGGNLTIETLSVELGQEYAARHVGVVPGSYVMLAVSDTGTGMDEDTQARIFDPFFTTKEKGKGTGLGLSTVYGIVKQSGGNIWVYSEPGHGTTFKVYLPELLAGSQETEAVTVESPMPGGSETILLVEDEDVVRGLARKILEQAGYNVLEASRGEEAVRLCLERAEPIDLLLTDVVMPVTSGKEVADRLREMQPGLRVLFMSGYTDEAIVHHGVLDANVEFIQKPFSPAALAKKVREVLDSELMLSN